MSKIPPILFVRTISTLCKVFAFHTIFSWISKLTLNFISPAFLNSFRIYSKIAYISEYFKTLHDFFFLKTIAILYFTNFFFFYIDIPLPLSVWVGEGFFFFLTGLWLSKLFLTVEILDFSWSFRNSNHDTCMFSF